MSELARVNKEYEELIRGLVSKLSEYNRVEMLDGYLDPIAQEYNSTLTELRLPTIKLSATGEAQQSLLEDCVVEYDRSIGLIKVYRVVDGIMSLKACIGEHQVGFEVYHCTDNSEVKRYMLDSDGWDVEQLGLDNFTRKWVAIHDPKKCIVTIYHADNMFPFKILGNVPEDLGYTDMMDMIRDSKTVMQELVEAGLQL